MVDVNNADNLPSSCGTNIDQPYLTWCNITCHSGYVSNFYNNSRQCQYDKKWSFQDEDRGCIS